MAWKPISRGGTNTGTTAKLRHKRIDPPQGVSIAVRALEDHVVVELGVVGQADFPPVLRQRRQGPCRGDRGLDGPGADQAAVQRHDVEYLDLGPVLDNQPLDDVDAVQLRLGRGHRGEIPASGRSGPAHPGAAIQSAPTPEDAVDGPHRGRRGQALSQQRLTDGVRADGSQIAVGQLASDLQHQILQGGARAPGLVRHGRAIRPIHAIQALPLARSTQWATVATPTPN